MASAALLAVRAAIVNAQGLADGEHDIRAENVVLSPPGVGREAEKGRLDLVGAIKGALDRAGEKSALIT